MILLAVVLLYGHTLHAPFYLDDQSAIIDRYLLRDLWASLTHVFSHRGLTTLSFAVNYRFSGLALLPLHLVNILIHAGCSLIVWCLLRRLIGGRWLALFGAMLFAAHPLQTQAVTYLIQRSTVLASFFALLALLLYMRARESLLAGQTRMSAAYFLPYGSALLAGVCALLAKENAAPLALALLACDRLLPGPKRPWRESLRDSLPFFIAPLLFGGAIMLQTSSLESMGGSQSLASMQHNSPLHYLITELSVFWVYLRLLILPYGQALEHDFPVVAELMNVQNSLAFAGILCLFLLAWWIRWRRPIMTFGIVWFFLGLLVESSVIPLDPLFEHRLYLPMFGFLLVLLDGLSLLGEKRARVVLVVALLVCAPLTWQRNALWNDPIALYEDNLKHVPGSERASETLAAYYGRVGRFAEERQQLETTITLFPGNPIASVNLAKVNAEEGRWPEAYALLEDRIKHDSGNAEYYEAAAEIAKGQGDAQRAIAYLRRGLEATGADSKRLLNDLGVLYSELGNAKLAEESFRASLALDKNNPAAQLNLGKLLYRQGRWTDALASLRRALDLEPGNPETLEGIAHSALFLGDFPTARWAAGKLEFIDSAAWQRVQAAIEADSAR